MRIKDIAEQTGFSESTVSRALNSDPRISADTTKKIMTFAKQHNYEKDYAAMNMNNDESNIIGVIFPPESLMNINNPFYIEIMKQAAYVADEHYYMVCSIISETPTSLSEKVESMLKRGKVKKYILLYNLANDPLVTQLKDSGVQFVIIGNPQDPDVYFVDNDNYQVGQQIGQRLIEKRPIQHPVYISSSNHLKYEVDRLLGFKQAFKDAEITLDEVSVPMQVDVQTNDEVCALTEKHDVVIVSSDDLLMRLSGLLSVSDKVDVISFNNSTFVQPLSERIHSIDLHPDEMGALAAQLLFTPSGQKDNFIKFSW